jgi:titin
MSATFFAGQTSRVPCWLRNLLGRSACPARPHSRCRRSVRLRLETLEGRWVPATITVTSLADTLASGGVTLRAALTSTNQGHDAPGVTHTGAYGVGDRIDFQFAGSGAHTIHLTSALPWLTRTVMLDGWSQVGSQYHGSPLIELDGSAAGHAVDGLIVAAPGSKVQGVAIVSFDGNGIYVTAGGSKSIVQGNYLGVAPDGAHALSNHGNGLLIVDSSGNTVGGTSSEAGNLISGNSRYGVEVIATAHGQANGNVIQGNSIGTNRAGTAPLGNGTYGVVIEHSSSNLVGGTTPGAGNLISGNYYEGMIVEGLIDAPSTNNVIQGNTVGTNRAGTASLGNQLDGIVIFGGLQSLVGGTTPGAGNLISGNSIYGLEFGGDTNIPATGNVAQGNLIGTNRSGTASAGTQLDGIVVKWACYNLVGGTAPGSANLISGNTDYGINVVGRAISPATRNLIEGNLIGTNLAGTARVANDGDGILINWSSNNTVGGTGAAANTVAYNGEAGIEVKAGAGNALLGNHIYSNQLLGIHLGDYDAPPGTIPASAPNAGQTAPVLTSVLVVPGQATFTGSLTSTPNTALTLEFFGNPAGTSQGKTSLIRATIRTDGRGHASFSFVAAVNGLSVGEWVTVTATDPIHNTSQFSNAVAVT